MMGFTAFSRVRNDETRCHAGKNEQGMVRSGVRAQLCSPSHEMKLSCVRLLETKAAGN